MDMKPKETHTFGYTPEEYKKFRKYGWRFLILYSVLYSALYCVRLNLANAGPEMISGLGFSTSDIGILTATLFWAYAVGMLIGGRASEVFGATRFIMISVLASVAVNIVFGFTRSLPVMIVLWAINGLAQSLNWPAGGEVLAQWWPGKSRGFAMGFASAFSGFGQAFATLAVALGLSLFPQLGWRSAFFVPAVFPLIFFVIYILFTKSSPEKIGLKAYHEENPEIEKAEEEMREMVRKNGKLYPYRYLLRDGYFVRMLIMHVFCGFSRYGLLTWVPMYFIERFGVDVMEGLFASLALPVGMGIGCLVMPTITDHLKDRMSIVPWSSFAAMICLIVLLFLDPRTAAGFFGIEAMLFIAGFFIYAVSGILNTIAIDAGGRVFNGTANGLVGFTGYMGAGFQSVLYGFIVAHIGWPMLFVSIAAFCALIGGMGLIRRKPAKS